MPKTKEMPIGYIEKKEQIPSIDNSEQAMTFIKELLEKGERPIVTVPEKYSEALKTGLKPKTSWIPGLEVIAATLGRSPHLPENEKRLLVKIKDISPEQIIPRFTGPDKKFHGVVVLDGPISPDSIEIL